MTPIVNGLADDYADTLNVYRLNAAESDVLVLQQQYGVRGHPSFALLDSEGVVIQRFLGPQDEQLLRVAVETLFVE